MALAMILLASSAASTGARSTPSLVPREQQSVVCPVRVFVYPLGDEWRSMDFSDGALRGCGNANGVPLLNPAGYDLYNTSGRSLFCILHERLLNSECRVEAPREANLFYIPYSVSPPPFPLSRCQNSLGADLCAKATHCSGRTLPCDLCLCCPRHCLVATLHSLGSPGLTTMRKRTQVQSDLRIYAQRDGDA